LINKPLGASILSVSVKHIYSSGRD